MEENLKELINTTLRTQYDYLCCCEKTLTKQTELIAKQKALTKALQAENEILQMFYENFFEERKMLYGYANEILNEACKKRNVQLAEISLEMIKTINCKKNGG